MMFSFGKPIVHWIS